MSRNDAQRMNQNYVKLRKLNQGPIFLGHQGETDAVHINASAPTSRLFAQTCCFA